MLHQAFSAQIVVEIMGFQGINGDSQPLLQIIQFHAAYKKRIIADNFGRRIFHHLIQKLPIVLHFGHIIIAGGYIRHGDACFPGEVGNAHNIIIFIFLQGLDIQVGSGRYNPDHLSLNQPLGQFGILHLFTDGNLVALAHQPA